MYEKPFFLRGFSLKYNVYNIKYSIKFSFGVVSLKKGGVQIDIKYSGK